MGFLTEREREILVMLSEGKKVSEIAKILGVSLASVSRSITRIRMKCMEIEDDIEFLQGIGFVVIRNNRLTFIGRDPKILTKRK